MAETVATNNDLGPSVLGTDFEQISAGVWQSKTSIRERREKLGIFLDENKSLVIIVLGLFLALIKRKK